MKLSRGNSSYGFAASIIICNPKFELITECQYIFSQAGNILGIPIIFTEQVPDKLGETDSSLTEALNGYKL